MVMPVKRRNLAFCLECPFSPIWPPSARFSYLDLRAAFFIFPVEEFVFNFEPCEIRLFYASSNMVDENRPVFS